MRSTVLAPKTHNYQIAEIRHADFTHFCFAHHVAGRAGHVEYCSFVMHEVILLEGLREVELIAELLFLDRLSLLFRVLLAISHLYQFF